MKNKLKVATILLILIVSGCSHYNNIPRQRSFFNTKSNINPVKEITQSFSKNKMGEIVKVENDSIFSRESTVNLAHEDRSDKDSQIIKPKEKFVSNFPRSTFFKESIAFAKSSLPKVLKFHESKKSTALNNKLASQNAFPLVLIMLGMAIGLIGLIFGIGYLTERRNESKPKLPPKSEKANKVKKKHSLLSTLSIFFWLLSILLVVIPIAFLVFLELNFLSFLILIYFLVAAAISASIALVFAIINYFVKKSKEKSQFKNSE